MGDTGALIGRSIRTYRKARRMTLEELSAGIHKSKATVGKYEQGTIALDIDTLYDIARCLGIRPGQLLADVPEKAPAHESGTEVPGSHRYMYHYDGRTSRISRALMVTGEGAEPPVTLFYNLPSFDEPERCRALYYGRLQRHEFVTNYILDNQSNNIEHIFLCFMKPLEASGQETGLLSGLSSRSLLPVSAKCILSDAPLLEDASLITRLLLTKEDMRLIRKYNMFIVEQAGV